MATKDSVDVRKSFNWLRREARGPTYISFSAFSDRPACSFDFGDNGCAASCNFGGELLQMSARDDEKGLVFAHGDFERTYYSSLARAQRKHGRQATFGLGIARNQKPYENDEKKNKSERGSNLKLGEMIERGCFNYRWPFNEYVLLLNEGDGSSLKETGTCTRVSFVQDGILYQVIRLEKGCRLEADICHYTPWMGQVALSVGGLVHFGELNTDVPYKKFDQSTLRSGLLSLEGSSNRLDIRVRQLIGDKYEDLPLYLPNNNEDYGAHNKAGSYRAYVDLPGTKNGNFQDRQVTFIAEFKLRKNGGNAEWPETPNSETIYDYLGIDCGSEMATGMMWETIFLQREEKSSYFSELSEVNLVGRCVEKILTVDLVPATIHKKGRMFNNERPLSLISNMFVQPSIDLESLFWKVRFLVKAYRFLSSFKDIHSQQVSDESSDNSTNQKPSNATKVESHDHTVKFAGAPVATIEEIVNFQMNRIQASIEGVVTCLVRTFIQPETHTSPQSLASKTFQSNYYYVMITIWYVIKRCESYNFKWNWIDDETKTWSAKNCLLSNCLPPDNLLPEHKERERVALLKWYHYASILNLTKRQMHLPQSWDKDGLNVKVNQLERDARRAAAAKLSSRHPYSAEDEIIDRLGFLAEPLNAELSRNRAGSVSSITSRRILERDYTHYLNPGSLLGGEKGPTSGPWEIHALCYHSRLLVENYQYKKNDEKTREQKVEDVEKYRRMISQFLNAEACLIPCWERTNITLFQSEATSVLASTLLSICQKDFTIAEGLSPTSKRERSYKSMSNEPGSLSHQTSKPHEHKTKSRHGASNMDHLLARLEAVQDTRMAAIPTIHWMKYRIPRRYHHENFFNSLEDTPELFKINQTEEKVNSNLPSLSNSQPLHAPRLENDEMSGVNSIIERHQISIIDFKASAPDHRNRSWPGYKYDPLILRNSGTNPLKRESQDETKKQARENRLDARKKLLDSLVDQEVQHRTIILAAPSSMNVHDNLKLFWKAFHVDSRDCFANHDTKFPDFSCQTGNTWITRITLRSWAVTKPNRVWHEGFDPNITQSISSSTSSIKSRDSKYNHEEGEDENAPIKMPDSLREALRSAKNEVFDPDALSASVELKVSSIVLSTNGFGDFSQCTIISELLQENPEELGQQCKVLWERFIHQPQTARCLVFLNILGLLCQQMAIHYRQSMNHFVKFIHAFEIEKSFTFDENNLLKGTHGLIKLKLGLWSLESLFKLYNSLVTSMKCIAEASTELRAQIQHGPGKRGEMLEKICQQSLGDFERKLNQLIVLHDELDQKIKLNSRYKDSLSTVLSLEDSRNSIRQNGTIQKLTYLTIGYLPMGLISAIFAIPSEQNVIIPKMGLVGFVVSIIGLFIITFTVAIFIEPILQNLAKVTSVGSPSDERTKHGFQLSWPKRGRASFSQPASAGSNSSTTIDVEKGKAD